MMTILHNQVLENQPENNDYQLLLPVYLQQNIANSLKKLEKISSPKELLQKLKKSNQSILWLDLELRTNGGIDELIEGAFVLDEYFWLFDQNEFKNHQKVVIKLINQASFLGGHNIINFDLPKLFDLLEQYADRRMSRYDNLNAWQKKSYDTLILSSLLLPYQKSHALHKLYKADTKNNNPIFDCVESRLILLQCHQIWQKLPHTWQAVFGCLLPAIRDLCHKDYVFSGSYDAFDWQDIVDDLPKGDKKALIDLLKSSSQTAQKWKNLGEACFLNWLRFFDKPVIYRPKWVMKHPKFKEGFVKAEQSFWQIPTKDDHYLETWLDNECQEFFGHRLREGQKNIVKHIFQDKNMTLGILPTGGGKSLAFQLPALIMSKYRRDLTVIISPLQALIEDQVIDLKLKLEKFQHSDYQSRVDYLTSNQTAKTQHDVLSRVQLGQVDILYLSPERLTIAAIKKLLKCRPPAFWVLDEAHTLSQWGMDFRPDFLRIADNILFCYDITINKSQQADLWDEPNRPKNYLVPKIALVTATASKKIRDDLKKEFTDKLKDLVGSNKNLTQCGMSPEDFQVWRDNIKLSFLNVQKDKFNWQEKKHSLHRGQRILEIILKRQMQYQLYCAENNKDNKGVVLVYIRNRKMCEVYADYFIKNYGLKATFYHSKLSKDQKKNVLLQFKNHELEVVVCTNAFGMGIDKEGIHTVIHSGVPNNLESYVQEIGRGARKEGEKACAYLLWSEEDIEVLFEQDRQSRIPNSKTLKDCWAVIKKVFDKRRKEESWITVNSFASILQNEGEELNTQVRIALLALERHYLLNEKERQPAYIDIKLKRKPDKNNDSCFVHIYRVLKEIGEQSENQDHTEFKCYLPDLAYLLGMSIKNVLKNIGKMVELGFISWKIRIMLRSRYSHKHQKTLFNKALKICEIMEECVTYRDHEHWSDYALDDSYVSIPDKALKNWLKNNQISLKTKDIFSVLRALNVLLVRKENNRWQIEATDATKDRLKLNNQASNLKSWLAVVKEDYQKLTDIFEYLQAYTPDKGSDKSDVLTYFELDQMALDLQLNCHDVLPALATLQKLNIFEFSCLDGTTDTVFLIEKGTKSKLYAEAAYQYLEEHYHERCQKIHVLHHWLKSDEKVKRQLLEDYFRYGIKDVIKKYLPDDIDSTKPYPKNYRQRILPDWFSQDQKNIITDTSRAALVLAGPGSGKTTVVVHKTAYLLMEENIDPQKILILAYNRMAVHEIRMRLKKLADNHCKGVTITTFHGLAREIVGRSENDALPEELKSVKQNVNNPEDAKYTWLIDEAIRTLKEEPRFYQYIIVDEFQDVDEKQYTLIGMLADLKKVEDDDIIHEEGAQTISQPKESAIKDSYDQQGYLMVVGDDDQNLYEWRGASVQFIQQFEKNYHILDNQKFYLLDNYRSSANIVNLANAFIEQSIPQEKRLKSAEYAVRPKGKNPDLAIRFAGFEHDKHIDVAHWLSSELKTQLATKQSIAILAPRWEIFDAVQHYLQEAQIQSQRLNEKENRILPVNSVIGKALQYDLIKICDDHQTLQETNAILKQGVKKFLTNWQQKQDLNPDDRAWRAILHDATSLSSPTVDELLDILRVVEYDNDDEVVALTTYHSAKGMEFDHVYVIDDRRSQNNANLGDVRSLYVALTRAKKSLTILQYKFGYNHILCDLLHRQKYGKFFNVVPTEEPHDLQFSRYLTLEEIVLTPKELTSNKTVRSFIPEKFTRQSWRKTLVANQDRDDYGYRGSGFYLGKQFLVGLSSQFQKWLRDKNAKIKMIEFTTTCYFQKDLSYYERVGYKGNEREHYLVVPFVTITLPLAKKNH